MQKQNVNFFPKPILEEISPRVENPISGDRKLSTSNSLLPSSVLDHSCKNNIENKTIQDQILKGEDLKNEIGRLERGKEQDRLIPSNSEFSIGYKQRNQSKTHSMDFGPDHPREDSENSKNKKRYGTGAQNTRRNSMSDI